MTAEDTAELTLAITEQAIEKVVRGFRAQSEDPENQALWVEVSGVSDGEYVYKISLNALHVARQDDVVQRHGDLTIVVPESSVEKLRGATIDWSQRLEQSGFTLVNPNKPPAPAELPMMSPPMAPPASPPIDAPPPADLSGDVAQRVIQVIDRQVNPAIAALSDPARLLCPRGTQGAKQPSLQRAPARPQAFAGALSPDRDTTRRRGQPRAGKCGSLPRPLGPAGAPPALYRLACEAARSSACSPCSPRSRRARSRRRRGPSFSTRAHLRCS